MSFVEIKGGIVNSALRSVQRYGVSIDLSSRAVASQVFSAPVSLTSVFGMGTGGPSPLMTLTILLLRYYAYEALIL